MGPAVLEAFGLAKTTTSTQRWRGYAGVLLCQTNLVDTRRSDWPRQRRACNKESMGWLRRRPALPDECSRYVALEAFGLAKTTTSVQQRERGLVTLTSCSARRV